MATQYIQASGTYGGTQEWPGTEHRCAGHFLDGIYQRSVIYSQDKFYVLGVDDTDVIAVISGALPPGVAVRSIGCIRSAQTGYLVLHVGGFYVNQGGQRRWVVSTGYHIAMPVTAEQYQAGQR